MKKELAIKQIYDDFINKVILNEEEKDVLTRYIKDESIIKIAGETSLSTSSVSRIILKLKTKYDDYRKIEIAKLKVFEKK